MKRTISVMVGAGSVGHNERRFSANNVDPERTHMNICYCNENLKDVYHELFDKAVERYNNKQTRKDRRIENYYRKIEGGKQEKLFHEVVIQVGNREDSNSKSEDGELTAYVLDKYMKSFQERNPNLRVFSAHLHMDEETPHLHIDYVPFTRGSTRGLDTRVSLKKALATQGFSGGAKSDTEWAQWAQSEKEVLANVMHRYGIEWQQKGTHEKHLSVLDYKKEMRQQEIEELNTVLEDTNQKTEQAKGRLNKFIEQADEVINKSNLIDSDKKYELPEISSFSSAKEYVESGIKPLIERFKNLIWGLIGRYNGLVNDYNDLNDRYDNQQLKLSVFVKENESLKNENTYLLRTKRSFEKVRSELGADQIEQILHLRIDKKNEKGR